MAGLIARAYVLSIPVVEGRLELSIDADSPLTKFVQANRAAFHSEGTTGCMRLLGASLARQGGAAYDQHAGDRVIEQFGGDAPEIAGQVARDVQRDANLGAQNAYLMGMELMWLADVLPAIADGNLEPYNAAGSLSRQQTKAILPMAEGVLNADPATAAQVHRAISESFRQIIPPFEQAIVRMSATSCGS
jgi:hypothetical protein